VTIGSRQPVPEPPQGAGEGLHATNDSAAVPSGNVSGSALPLAVSPVPWPTKDEVMARIRAARSFQTAPVLNELLLKLVNDAMKGGRTEPLTALPAWVEFHAAPRGGSEKAIRFSRRIYPIRIPAFFNQRG
jgi:hypothetical protein